ncbi:MAG: hypothetical protein D6805_06290, partial [Planctomycetota bacterium]
EGGDAAYWNPAAMAFEENRRSELTLFDDTFEVVLTEELVRTITQVQETISLLQGGNLESFQTALNSNSVSDANQIGLLGKTLDFMLGLTEGTQKGYEFSIPIHLLNIDLGLFTLGASFNLLVGAEPRLDLTNLVLNTSGSFGSRDTLFGAAFDPNTANPSTQAGQTLANDLFNAGGGALSQDQAEALVYLLEKQGVDVSNPLYQSLLKAVVQNTANRTGLQLSQNGSGLYTSLLILSELRVSKAWALIDRKKLGFAVGGTLRALHGITYTKLIPLKDLENANSWEEVLHEAIGTVENQIRNTVQLTFDASFLVRYGIFRFGITGKNILPVRFPAKFRKSFKLEPQFRAGAAVVLRTLPGLATLIIASDVDLWETESPVSLNMDYQSFHFGVEFRFIDTRFLRVAARLGTYTNFANSSEDEVYTLGAGVLLGPLSLDVAVAMDREAIQSGNYLDLDFKNLSIPERVSLGLTLKLVFSF